MITKNQIHTLANTIAKKFGTQKIFLFGSYAYGQPQYESDIDLCIITNLGEKRKIELIRDIRREISLNFHLPIDILVYDNVEFKERAIHRNTLEYKILNQGVIING